MKIKSVKITNFLTIGSTVSLNLDDRGLILIIGDNRDDTSADSNGAGKSTIGDAISWCLYGITIRGESGDEVVNNLVGKDCSVYQEVVDGLNTYAITRYRKHKKFKNSLQVENLVTGLSLTQGTDKLTQEVVDKIIGCSCEVFKSAIYSGQDSIPNLPGMTDKFLKEIVEEAAGINRLSEAHSIAKADLKLKEADLKASVFVCDAKQARLTTIEANLLLLQDKNVTYDSDKLVKMKALKVDWLNAKKELEEIEADPLFLASEKEFDDQIAVFDLEMNDALDKIKALEMSERSASNSLNTSTIAFGVKEREFRGEMVKLTSIQARVGEPCGECGKPYHEDDLDDAIAIVNKNILALKKSAKSLRDKVVDDKALHQNALAALSRAGDRSVIISKNSLATGKAKASKAVLLSVKQRHNAATAALKNLTLRAKALKDEKSPYSEMINAALVEINNIKLELVDAVVDIKTLNDDKNLLSDAVNVFSPAGVRGYIIDTVTPFLNDRTAHYLSTLTDGNISAVWSTLSRSKSGEIKERFAIDACNEKGAKLFGGLSGGEKRKVRVATMLALQDLVASRASKPFSLFIADEIDDALDSAGLERLMVILDEKSREKGTVLIISHNDIGAFVREQSTVIKEGGFSRVEGVLSEH